MGLFGLWRNILVANEILKAFVESGLLYSILLRSAHESLSHMGMGGAEGGQLLWSA